jgi:6-phosphogluconate dehydrogenase
VATLGGCANAETRTKSVAASVLATLHACRLILLFLSSLKTGFRFLSSSRQFYASSRIAVGKHSDALYAAKIASYTQGFAMLRTASEERGYGSDFCEISRIGKEGCIIRAGFLDRVREAFAEDPELSLLAQAPSFQAELATRLPALRRVVSAAATAGLPIPGLSASLAYFDTLVCGSGSANLIQAQRDYFGSHTYERLDAPGTAVHTDWPSGKPSS